MKTQCTNCLRAFRVSDEYEGKKAKCPRCGKAFRILRIEENKKSAHSSKKNIQHSTSKMSSETSKHSIPKDELGTNQFVIDSNEYLEEEGKTADSKVSSLKQIINAACILCLTIGAFIVVVPSLDIILGSSHSMHMIMWASFGVLLEVGSLLGVRFFVGYTSDGDENLIAKVLLMIISMISVFLIFLIFMSRFVVYCTGILVIILTLLYFTKTINRGIKAIFPGIIIFHISLALIILQPMRVMNIIAKLENRNELFATDHDKYKQLVSSLPNAKLDISKNQVVFETMNKAVVFVGKGNRNEFVQSPNFCESYIGNDILASRPEDVKYIAVVDVITVGYPSIRIMEASTHLWVYKWPEETLVISRNIKFDFDASFVFTKVSFIETFTNQTDHLISKIPFFVKEERSLFGSDRNYMKGHFGSNAFYSSFSKSLREALVGSE